MSWNTPQAATSVDVTMNRYAHLSDNNIIEQWLHAKKELAAIKEREMELRKVVTKRLFPNPSKGTQRVSLQGEAVGNSLKLVHKLNYNLPGKTDNKKIDLVEDEICKIGNEGKFIVDRLISWQADLSVSEYNKLSADAADGSGAAIAIKKLVDSILTISPAAPELELEPPKS